MGTGGAQQTLKLLAGHHIRIFIAGEIMGRSRTDPGRHNYQPKGPHHHFRGLLQINGVGLTYLYTGFTFFALKITTGFGDDIGR